MNSIQLFQRLARNLNVPDVFNLPADAALDVLAAGNGGLATFYREMPGIYRRTTLSYAIRTPRTLNVTFTAKYSRLVAADTFAVRENGCTVRFTNGGADHVVTGQNSVLDDYIGADAGQAIGATLYSDAVPVQDVIERIIGHVRLYDTTNGLPTMVLRDERLRGGGATRTGGMGAGDGQFYPYEGEWACGVIDRPRYYYLEPMGASQGAEPEFLLRVAPLPDADYTIRMEAELSTQRLTMADITTARTINVSEAYLDDILVPLCEAELVTSRFWQSDGGRADSKAAALNRAAGVMANKMPKIPMDIAPAGNRVGTPRGF